jgi:hypothetical protein
LVFSIHGPTEVAIQKMIEASERMLRLDTQGELGAMSPAMKRRLELEIETLRNTPRDADKLQRIVTKHELVLLFLLLLFFFKFSYQGTIRTSGSEE